MKYENAALKQTAESRAPLALSPPAPDPVFSWLTPSSTSLLYLAPSCPVSIMIEHKHSSGYSSHLTSGLSIKQLQCDIGKVLSDLVNIYCRSNFRSMRRAKAIRYGSLAVLLRKIVKSTGTGASRPKMHPGQPGGTAWLSRFHHIIRLNVTSNAGQPGHYQQVSDPKSPRASNSRPRLPAKSYNKKSFDIVGAIVPSRWHGIFPASRLPTGM